MALGPYLGDADSSKGEACPVVGLIYEGFCQHHSLWGLAAYRLQRAGKQFSMRLLQRWWGLDGCATRHLQAPYQLQVAAF